LAGKTGLKDLIEVIRCAKFVVCNDTGPMHIAAALGVPVFAIFGPSSPVRTGPYGDRNTVIRKGIPCSPCYKRSCKNIKCMTLIEPNEVIDLVSNYLNMNITRR
jgi:ADP-heptose:LPS heptosyltransferase